MILIEIPITVRPRDTRPLHTRVSQVHGFLLGPETFDFTDFAIIFQKYMAFLNLAK